MKIQLTPDVWKRHIQSQVGSTWAEKSMRAGHEDDSAWAQYMRAHAGQWVEVETDYLFDDQFNTEGARVDSYYIDAICFEPEYADLEAYMAAVAVRYAKDWPALTPGPLLRRRIELGLIKVVPLGQISEQGDSHGG